MFPSSSLTVVEDGDGQVSRRSRPGLRVIQSGVGPWFEESLLDESRGFNARGNCAPISIRGNCASISTYLPAWAPTLYQSTSCASGHQAANCTQ